LGSLKSKFGCVCIVLSALLVMVYINQFLIHVFFSTQNPPLVHVWD
jgi:hypothetical protein